MPEGQQRAFSSPDWRLVFARRLWISDAAVLAVTVFGGQLIWEFFGRSGVPEGVTDLDDQAGWLLAVVLWLGWLLALSLVDSRSSRVIGTGNTEYVRIADASLRLFGAVAILAFLLKIDLTRSYLLATLPIGVLLVCIERWIWRLWLIRRRRSGAFSARVLLVGSERSVAQIARELQRAANAGYVVVGACVPTGRIAETIEGTGIPIIGRVDAIPAALERAHADTVAVTSTDELPPDKVKQISWSLEAGRQHLVLAPSIMDIAGPRLHTRPVSGLPLIHVETPRFSKGQRVLKRCLDITASAAGVIVLAPLLLTIALTVKLTSPGPVLFRQERVGKDGVHFTMLKFRTMVVNAEELLDTLREGQDAGNEILFKMHNDPRVTGPGRLLRKFSLDELPQLFNVFAGSMSLVGPRPPLPSEVERYADHVHRRFLAKPGITGLWQVSGRSSLSWEESVRLDLSYVENWTLLGDIVILFRTAKAALAPGETAA